MEIQLEFSVSLRNHCSGTFFFLYVTHCHCWSYVMSLHPCEGSTADLFSILRIRFDEKAQMTTKRAHKRLPFVWNLNIWFKTYKIYSFIVNILPFWLLIEDGIATIFVFYDCHLINSIGRICCNCSQNETYNKNKSNNCALLSISLACLLLKRFDEKIRTHGGGRGLIFKSNNSTNRVNRMHPILLAHDILVCFVCVFLLFFATIKCQCSIHIARWSTTENIFRKIDKRNMQNICSFRPPFTVYHHIVKSSYSCCFKQSSSTRILYIFSVQRSTFNVNRNEVRIYVVLLTVHAMDGRDLAQFQSDEKFRKRILWKINNNMELLWSYSFFIQWVYLIVLFLAK